MTLMLSFGVAATNAQAGPVNMTVSGSAVASTVTLQPGVPFFEYLLSGSGTFGQFDLRVLSAGVPAPQKSTTCSGPTKLYLAVTVGAGVFHFADGSFLSGTLTGGGDCIDFAVGQALCVRVFQVSGGTGRFAKAAGTVTLTMTVIPIMVDGSGNPAFFAVTGEVTGAVPGGIGEKGPEGE